MSDKTDTSGTDSGHVRNMSATEHLRALLTERGVEWDDDGYPTTCTVWESNGIVWHGLWRDDCIELIAHLTPKQAIDATLGRGTCHAVFEVDAMSEDDRVGEFVCSECGETFGDGRDQRPNYCPNCGRRCVG